MTFDIGRYSIRIKYDFYSLTTICPFRIINYALSKPPYVSLVDTGRLSEYYELILYVCLLSQVRGTTRRKIESSERGDKSPMACSSGIAFLSRSDLEYTSRSPSVRSRDRLMRTAWPLSNCLVRDKKLICRRGVTDKRSRDTVHGGGARFMYSAGLKLVLQIYRLVSPGTLAEPQEKVRPVS